MGKKTDLTIDGCPAVHLSAPEGAAYNLGNNPLFMVKKQTAILTSLLGTQLLLTTSPPDYPIIKATRVVPEVVS